MTAAPVLPSGTAVSRPGISVGAGARELGADTRKLVVGLSVDTSLHVPDTFEIVFADPAGDVVDRAGLRVGTEVTISAVALGSDAAGPLVAGEVTALEGVFGEVRQTVVRGYSKDHRLQRRRTTRTFLNMTDSDIASKVAREAGLTVGTVVATRTAHDHVGQTNQTDWEFLRSRAVRIGYEFGVDTEGFYFRPASVTTGGTAVPLEFPVGLRTFRPRITSGNLAASSELRSWDVAASTSAASVVATTTESVALDTTVEKMAAAFAPKAAVAARPATPSGGPHLGPEPSQNAYVMAGRPAGDATARAAADEVAKGLAEELGSSFAEATGETAGDPRLLAGCVVAVSGVGTTFSGKWTISRAVHEFQQGDYRTTIEVSGRQDRSLLGLATGGPETETRIPGLVAGVVTNIADPEKQGRVKVSLPWLSPTYETWWAPVAHAGSGERTAALFPPEVGDEVLVGFEHGAPERPYVIGGLVTKKSVHALGGETVKRSGNTASIAWRGVVTPTGNRLAFHDETAPGGGKATASDLVLGTAGGDMALLIDQTAGTVSLRCSPKPPGSNAAQGNLTIECGDGGAITVKTGAGGKIDVNGGAGGSVTVDGGAQLTLKAQAAVNIESQGVVSVKGNPIKLN